MEQKQDARPGFYEFGLSGTRLRFDAALGIDVHHRERVFIKDLL